MRTFNVKLVQVSDAKGSFEVPATMQLMGVVLHESSNYKSGTAVFVQAMPTEAEQEVLDEQQAVFEVMRAQAQGPETVPLEFPPLGDEFTEEAGDE